MPPQVNVFNELARPVGESMLSRDKHRDDGTDNWIR